MTASAKHTREAVDHWASMRRPYLDNLKVIMIGLIIAAHGVVGYASYTDGIWAYANVAEVRLSAVTETIFLGLALPFVVFMIALLFLVAGLLTPPSLSRKGTGRFVRDRLLRLGVPFAVFTLLLWPLALYALYRPFGHIGPSYWRHFIRSDWRWLDTGPLWFVAVLLIFSIAYATWAQVRQGRPSRWPHHEITGQHLLLLAAGVTAATFLVRLVFPFGSEGNVADLNLWEWPACIALFGLGVAASRQGWLAAVPDRLRRQSRAATMIALGAAAAFLASGDALGVEEAELWGGWHWPALALAAIEGFMTVFGSVWLLAVAQRRLDRRVRLGPLLGRSAYGAFMLQAPVLIALAVALRPAPLPAGAKALVVAVGGVAASFALAWLLITRAPRLTRIL